MLILYWRGWQYGFLVMAIWLLPLVGDGKEHLVVGMHKYFSLVSLNTDLNDVV